MRVESALVVRARLTSHPFTPPCQPPHHSNQRLLRLPCVGGAIPSTLFVNELRRLVHHL